MFELTEQQRQELSAPEPIAIDPQTRETYVLVRKAVFDRMKGLLYDDAELSDDELRLLLARSSATNGWDEPEMAEYED